MLGPFKQRARQIGSLYGETIGQSVSTASEVADARKRAVSGGGPAKSAAGSAFDRSIVRNQSLIARAGGDFAAGDTLLSRAPRQQAAVGMQSDVEPIQQTPQSVASGATTVEQEQRRRRVQASMVGVQSQGVKTLLGQ